VIADILGISEETINAHPAQVMRKMRVASMVRLVLLAEKVGLTAP
jgi:DNA-binding CsgD family transcriptional regulator